LLRGKHAENLYDPCRDDDRGARRPKPGPAQDTKQPAKSFAIFFYETPQAFANRTNKNAAGYWKKWTSYIGSIQGSGAMESGSGLLPPTISAEIDKRGERKVGTRGVRLSGFVVVKVATMKDATAIARRSPAIGYGGKVEVREVLPMSQDQGGK